MFPLFFRDDASQALLLGDANLFDGVDGEWVGRGDEKLPEVVAIFIGNEVSFNVATIRECESVGSRERVVRTYM